MQTQEPTAESKHARLLQLFRRNGYTRAPRDERRRELGRKYKKGWEVRLVLKTQEELDEVRGLLAQAGLKAAKPFKKSKRWAQPIYGKEAVELFLQWSSTQRRLGKGQQL